MYICITHKLDNCIPLTHNGYLECIFVASFKYHSLSTKNNLKIMYRTSGINAVASITELRSSTSELVEYVRDTQTVVLIQKNNKPYAVLIDWETYQRMNGKSVDVND